MEFSEASFELSPSTLLFEKISALVEIYITNYDGSPEDSGPRELEKRTNFSEKTNVLEVHPKTKSEERKRKHL